MNGIINAQFLVLIFNWLITIISVLIIYYDFRYMRIPNFLVIGIAVFAVIKVGVEYQYLSFINDLIFPVIFLGLLLFFLIRLFPNGLGKGDVKFLYALSIYFNWWIFPILWLASLSGILHFLFIAKIQSGITKIPFGIHIAIWTMVLLQCNCIQNMSIFELL